MQSMLSRREDLPNSYDDLGLEYLWNGDEYSSLENSLKAMEKNAEQWRTTRNLSPSACYREKTLLTMRLRQRHCIWRSFTDCPDIDILYYPEERDDKGELIKSGHYVLLPPQRRRSRLWLGGAA